jgi:hypothetical protein
LFFKKGGVSLQARKNISIAFVVFLLTGVGLRAVVGGVLVSVSTFCAVDCGFETWSNNCSLCAIRSVHLFSLSHNLYVLGQPYGVVYML